MISKYGEDFLKRWVSTVAIIICHVQTIGIIGNLSIEWPPAVIWITTTLSGNILDLGFIRPECLLQDVDVSPYYVFTLGACGIILSTFSILVLARVCVLHLGARCLTAVSASYLVDQIDFLQSIIFSAQLTPTWQIAAQLIATAFTGELFGALGGVMALLLLVFDAVFLVYYFLHIRRIEIARRSALPAEPFVPPDGNVGLCCGLVQTLAPYPPRGSVPQRGNHQGRRVQSLSMFHTCSAANVRVFRFASFVRASASTFASRHSVSPLPSSAVSANTIDARDVAVLTDADVAESLINANELRHRRSILRVLAAPGVIVCGWCERWFSCSVPGTGGICNPPKLTANMEYRLSYLTDRFSEDEPSWQFVIWLRQGILFLDATIGRKLIVGVDQRMASSGGINGTGSLVATVSNTTYVNGTYGNATRAHDEFGFGLDRSALVRRMDTSGLVALWAHAGIALSVLLLFWYRHVLREPYEFAFQNAIESWLYFANIVVITLGGLYTIFGTTTIPDGVRLVLQPAVEVIMVFILVGSCLGAGLYLAYGYWGNMQLEGLSNRLASERVSGGCAAPVGARSQSPRWARRQQAAQSVKSVRSAKDSTKSPFNGTTSPFMRVGLRPTASCDRRELPKLQTPNYDRSFQFH